MKDDRDDATRASEASPSFGNGVDAGWLQSRLGGDDAFLLQHLRDVVAQASGSMVSRMKDDQLLAEAASLVAQGRLQVNGFAVDRGVLLSQFGDLSPLGAEPWDERDLEENDRLRFRFDAGAESPAQPGARKSNRSAGSESPPKPPAEEVQKFKLIELVEVVERGSLGSVAGAAPASKAPDCPKILDRKEKDGGAFKQFVNVGKNVRGAAKRQPEHGRYVELRARIEWTSGDKTKSLAGKSVYWSYTMTKHSGGKRPANLNGGQNPGFNAANGVKTVTNTTDDQGWTPVVKFYLSQFGGDKFTVSAQADEAEQGSASGTKLTTGQYVVWRKFWYQTTHARGRVIAAPAKSVAAYKATAADMIAADTVTYTKADVAAANRTFYPTWMVAGGNDATDAVVIGGHNRDWFYGKFKAQASRPVKGHLILCDHQWDPAGSTGLYAVPMKSTKEDVTLDLGAWNAGILKPALKGKLVAYGKWKVERRGKFREFFHSIGVAMGVVGEITREGDLSDDNFKVNAGRSGLNEVTVELPADCPNPKKYPVTVEFKLRYGKYYAGESNVHQMLIVYTAGEDKEFNQVVSHEFGHGFGQSPRPGTQPAGLVNHPKQYTNEHGGVGSHCHTGATLGAVTSDAPSGLYSGGTCVMFHQVNPSGCTQKFCADCEPYVRLQNMDALH